MDMLIIVPREGAPLYDGLKARQEANGQDRVVLDRRRWDRRRAATSGWKLERRTGERRAPVSDAGRALLNVLGFMILHPDPHRAQQPVTAAVLPSSSLNTPANQGASARLSEAQTRVTPSTASLTVIHVVNERRRWVVQVDGRNTLRFRPRARSRAVAAALDLAKTMAPALVVVHTAEGRARQTIRVGMPLISGEASGQSAHEGVLGEAQSE
jgi:Uncharacterized protein conserved in bacteria (DUF2188)